MSSRKLSLKAKLVSQSIIQLNDFFLNAVATLKSFWGLLLPNQCFKGIMKVLQATYLSYIISEMLSKEVYS